MAMKLAENIRAMRRANRLTQEQLAEVLGVTVGAVHKWEARLSVPELPIIMELADFFDTSVDALLGYELKDNRLAAIEARLWRFHAEKDAEGLSEAEKALKKYPNAFGVAYASAALYHGIGMEAHDSALLRRALELYEKARQLLPQNRDATVNDQILCGSVAQVWFALGEKERSVELSKAQNAGNLYSPMIGVVLATELNRPEEALPYLSRSLVKVFNDSVYVTLGLASVYRARRDSDGGIAILEWALRTLRGLKREDRPDFIDKLSTVFHASLAGFLLDAGDGDAARASLERALSLARGFDAAPDYSLLNLRFICQSERTGATYDILGATATEAVENVLGDIGSDALWKIYHEINDQIPLS